MRKRRVAIVPIRNSKRGTWKRLTFLVRACLEPSHLVGKCSFDTVRRFKNIELDRRFLLIFFSPPFWFPFLVVFFLCVCSFSRLTSRARKRRLDRPRNFCLDFLNEYRSFRSIISIDTQWRIFPRLFLTDYNRSTLVPIRDRNRPRNDPKVDIGF